MRPPSRPLLAEPEAGPHRRRVRQGGAARRGAPPRPCLKRSPRPQSGSLLRRCKPQARALQAMAREIIAPAIGVAVTFNSLDGD